MLPVPEKLTRSLCESHVVLFQFAQQKLEIQRSVVKHLPSGGCVQLFVTGSKRHIILISRI